MLGFQFDRSGDRHEAQWTSIPPTHRTECTLTTKVAINGLGRIGRAILKLVIDEPSFDLVAINDLVDVENLAYLLRFDTVYGRYSKVCDGRRR